MTGTIGDGTLGLAALRGELPDPDGSLADRYRLPRPRLGLALAGIAHAAIDVSDGLLQDLGHLCREGGVGARIRVDHVPASAAADAAGPEWLQRRLTGGDDYELLLAVPPASEPALLQAAAAAGVPVTRIGSFDDAFGGVRAEREDGGELIVARPGWSHL